MLLENQSTATPETDSPISDNGLEQAKLQSLGKMVAGIVHEINTPIQYITDNLNFVHEQLTHLDPLLELIERDQLELDQDEIKKVAKSLDLSFMREELGSSVGDSLSGIRHVSKLVAAVRSFSYRDKGQRVFNVNDGIDLMIAISRNEWKEHAEVLTSLQSPLPNVFGSESQLSQVWLNLIVNAAQATSHLPDVTGRIEVTTRKFDARVEIRIADNGTGMDETVQARLFERFFTTKPKGKGTGQGLAICWQIIQQHGGKIDVRSAPNEGTEFIIELPIFNKD